MRYFEIASGLRLPVSCEEWEVLGRIDKEPVAKDDLEDRERELARKMVSRGLLDYFKRDDRTFYRAVSAADIWRDRDDY